MGEKPDGERERKKTKERTEGRGRRMGERRPKRIKAKENRSRLNCFKLFINMMSFDDLTTRLSADAEFILLVEKDAAFQRLAEDRFYNKYPW